MIESNIDSKKYKYKNLSEPDKTKLILSLYQVFKSIWHGYSLDQFKKTFFNDNYIDDDIYVFTVEKTIIGYLLLRTIRIEMDHKIYSIMRISANITNQYLGKQLTLIPTASSGIKFFLKTLVNKQYFAIFLTANSPSSYSAIINRSLFKYPSPKKPIPFRYMALFTLISQRLKIPVKENLSFVCQYSGIKLNNETRKAMKWRHSPAREFYKKYCPNYTSGEAMIVIIPLNLFTGFCEIFHQIYLASIYKIKTLFGLLR